MGRQRVRRGPIALVILLGTVGQVAGCSTEESEPAPPCLPNAPDACTTVDGVALGRLVAVHPARRPEVAVSRPDRDSPALAWEALDWLHPGHPSVTALEVYDNPPVCTFEGCLENDRGYSAYLFRFADEPPAVVEVGCFGVGPCMVWSGSVWRVLPGSAG